MAARAVGRAQEPTQATFNRLRAQIDVKPEELLCQQVPRVSFSAGAGATQKQDRPIF